MSKGKKHVEKKEEAKEVSEKQKVDAKPEAVLKASQGTQLKDKALLKHYLIELLNDEFVQCGKFDIYKYLTPGGNRGLLHSKMGYHDDRYRKWFFEIIEELQIEGILSKVGGNYFQRLK